MKMETRFRNGKKGSHKTAMYKVYATPRAAIICTKARILTKKLPAWAHIMVKTIPKATAAKLMSERTTLPKKPYLWCVLYAAI